MITNSDKDEVVLNSGSTVIHIAVLCDHINIMKWIIDRVKQDPVLKVFFACVDDEGLSATYRGISLKNNRTFLFWLEQPQVLMKELVLESTDQVTTLMQIVKCGNIKAATLISEVASLKHPKYKQWQYIG